jgi:hypothetical protein
MLKDCESWGISMQPEESMSKSGIVEFVIASDISLPNLTSLEA